MRSESQTGGSRLMEAALSYQRRGWAVLPLAPRDKVPAIAGGCRKATCDEDDATAFWEHRPDCNVGIATGDASGGLLVIDLDEHANGASGFDVLREWERVHGELPETVSSITGRGGQHLIYRCNQLVNNSVGPRDSEVEGVDVRGDGGYIVAPPSVHPDTGREYAWENDPDEYAVAAADSRVMEFVRWVQSFSKPAERERFKVPPEIKQGQRDDTMMRLAASMQAQGFDDALILSQMEAVNKARCKPPLPQADIERIAASVCGRYEKGNAHRTQGMIPQKTHVSLMMNSSMRPIQSIENCSRVLSGDSALAGRFYYDLRGYTRMLEGPVPWDDRAGVRAVSDADYCGLAAYMEREYGLVVKQKAVDAVVTVSMQNRRNTVAEWLDSLAWDGEERIAYLLPMFLGCDASDYNMSVARLLMLGAAARAYEPGAKFDYMPVLIGPQGIGKSQFVRMLGVREDWYCDNLSTIEGDAAAEKLRGMWVVEMAELLATKNMRAVESIKAFVTSRVDTIRPKYARETEQRPRGCVFVGTTNTAQFLTDSTGNRRFLPVECGRHPAQLSLWGDVARTWFEGAWAQAAHIWRTERPPLVLDAANAARALEMQEAALEDDPRIGLVQKYLDEKLDAWEASLDRDPKHVRVCVAELMEHALPESMTRLTNRTIQNDLHQIMQTRADGWCRHPGKSGKARTEGYGVQRCYVPERYASEL